MWYQARNHLCTRTTQQAQFQSKEKLSTSYKKSGLIIKGNDAARISIQ